MATTPSQKPRSRRPQRPKSPQRPYVSVPPKVAPPRHVSQDVIPPNPRLPANRFSDVLDPSRGRSAPSTSRTKVSDFRPLYSGRLAPPNLSIKYSPDPSASSAVLRSAASGSSTSTPPTQLISYHVCQRIEGLVGDIQSKVDSIISLLNMESNDKCFIGIWGARGIGKTTLARLVYDKIQREFDATCFLDNTVEDSERVGLVSLQKKLLSGLGFGELDIDDFSEGAQIIRNFFCHKKVLVVLDNVNEMSQVKYLAGNKEWFGAGSKMVITTRDKIKFSTLYERFEVKRLNPVESLELLRQEACRNDKPGLSLDLLINVIGAAAGLPLVLKVLGSFLFKNDEHKVIEAIQRLEPNLTNDICRTLRISYDGLEDEECKRIFLDIACFFNKDAKFKVTSILKICGVDSARGIQVLIEKSMLNLTRSNSYLRQNAKGDQDTLFGGIQKMRRGVFLPTNLYDWLLQEASKEYLYMHDLLQEMGRDVVCQESPTTNAGSRSRLWSLKDIDDVLKENKGNRNVHSIVLHIRQSFEADWHPDCFSNMQELVLLDLSNVHLSRDLNSLPGSLKIMRWDYYALESLPPVYQSKKQESLQMCNSKIRKLWNKSPELHNLRTIDLSNSDFLMETPDFSGTPNLQKLFFNYCENLVRVHESVGQLKKLVELSLRYCTNIATLPTRLDMNDLEVFILGECSKLEKLPEFSQNMTRLYFLDVRNTDITEIPLSIIRLTNLKHLDLAYCSRLKSIPELPPNLIISASNCRLLEPTYALRYLYASCARKGPIHLFYDFQLWTRIPTWFERWEYCWGKDPSSGELVTITANIPSDVVADSNEQCCWGIAVCVVFQYLSQAWLGFSVDWKFEADNSHANKTKIHGTPLYYMHDCRVYVGFCPFDAIDRSQLPSGQGRQLDLTLHFPKTNIVNGLQDLEIMGCGWRLASNKDFDEWSESTTAPSPPRLPFLK